MADQIITKQCSKCKETKSVSEFNKSSKYQYQRWCKICQRNNFRQYYRTEKGKIKRKEYHQSEAYKEKQNRYKKSEKGQIVEQKYQNSEKGKQKHRIDIKRFFSNNPNCRNAYNAVNHAVSAGRLPRPDSLQCFYCREKAQEYHHTNGYEPEHWFDIIPVCIKCHISIS